MAVLSLPNQPALTSAVAGLLLACLPMLMTACGQPEQSDPTTTVITVTDLTVTTALQTPTTTPDHTGSTGYTPPPTTSGPTPTTTTFIGTPTTSATTPSTPPSTPSDEPAPIPTGG